MKKNMDVAVVRLFVMFCFLMLTGCGSGSDSGGSDSVISIPEASKYISWNDSSNGEYVVDAYNKMVRFLKTTGVMEYNGSQYPATVVAGSDLSVNGKKIGSINYVGSTSGGKITGLVGTDGKYLAISVDTSGNLTFGNTNITPSSATSTSGGTGDTSSGSVICMPSQSLGKCTSYYQCTPKEPQISQYGYYYTNLGKFEYNDFAGMEMAAQQAINACLK